MTRLPRGNECQCVTCGEFFGSPSGFTRHLAKVGCNPPDGVRNKHGERIFALVERKGGPTWVFAGERPNATIPAGARQEATP